jgi:glutamate/tyrosine decarboxylase-like PLP-dependent enzyme
VCYGTTSVGSVDNILECIPIAQEYGMWVHVDAAWAGAYLMLPQYQTLNGFKDCDSLVFNPHKMMLTNWDCTALWTRNKYDFVDALTADASYYKNYASSSGKVVDYKDLEVPMGRGFRALKLWFVMRNYGAKGLKQVMTNNLELTEHFVDMINRDNIFEITHPTIFSLVCCRMKPITSDEPEELTNRRNQWIFDKIFEEGKFLVGHATFRTRYIFRISIGNNQNTTSSLSELYDLMKELALKVDQYIN